MAVTGALQLGLLRLEEKITVIEVSDGRCEGSEVICLNGRDNEGR